MGADAFGCWRAVMGCVWRCSGGDGGRTDFGVRRHSSSRATSRPFAATRARRASDSDPLYPQQLTPPIPRLGTSTTISTPLIFEQELKIGGKDVQVRSPTPLATPLPSPRQLTRRAERKQIQDPLPYASYLRKFPLPTTSTTSSSTSSHPPPPPSRVPSISRGPKTCIPPAVTPTAILARPFKKFKGLVPMNRSDSVDRERELREKAEKAERERKKREDEERRVAREKKENEAMVVDEELVSSQGVDEEYGEGEEGSGEEEVEVPRSSQKRGAVQGEVAKGSSQEGKGAGSSESKMEVDEEVVIVEVKDKGKEKAVEVVKPKGGLVPRPKPWDNLRLSQAQDDTPPESHYYLVSPFSFPGEPVLMMLDAFAVPLVRLAVACEARPLLLTTWSLGGSTRPRSIKSGRETAFVHFFPVLASSSR